MKSEIRHKWIFDLPWELVNLKDWFYMVNKGFIFPTIFLHVRILGIRSLWEIDIPLPEDFFEQYMSEWGREIVKRIRGIKWEM